MEIFGTGVRFCSESCFASSRRATFKRAKTCNWCFHVRHAVSYVDFQDGASQLQFCSDKCLNQYKMQIFIKETQAHLEMNPHLIEKGGDTNLITPELWMKNCRSRSASPDDQREIRPNRSEITEKGEAKEGSSWAIGRSGVTVTPVAKLLPHPPSVPEQATQRPMEVLSSRPSMKTMRKRRSMRPVVRETPSALVQRQEDVGHHHQHQNISPCNQLPSNPLPLNAFERGFLSPPPHLFPIRPPRMSQSGQTRVDNHLLPPLPNLRPAPDTNPPRMNFPAQFMTSQVPPVTVLVPCPILLPIPVPIPIPINMPEFLLRLLAARDHKLTTHSISSDVNNNHHHANERGEGNSQEQVDAAASRDHQNVPQSESELSDNGSSSLRSCEIVLPKLKITRQSKRIHSTARESDSSRPLRKRKRIVVDYN